MSLLLEALKKAERAKEEAQRRARGESASAAEAPAAAAGERKSVVTRDKLPDISQGLEIESADLAPLAPPQRPVPELALEPETANEASRPRSTPAGAAPADAEVTARASARKVFEAKFREPNPRMPFYLTLGALGIFALGTIVYFWYELRPAGALVNLNPPRAVEPLVPPPETARAAPSAPASPGSASAIPGLPGAPAKSAVAAIAPAPPVAAPQPMREPAAEAPRLRAPEPRRIAPTPQTPASVASVARRAPEVNPKVAAAYAAYVAGDPASARSAYEDALREEPANRDALLGLAALEVRAGRYESAEALYLRALQVDPRDADAQAALIALRSGRSDPLVTESRVKSLIAADPAAHALHFTLGNQLAAQNRWAEAEQEYFKAYAADPDNADFAYNLAVSLDHLHQAADALRYYQRALELSATRGAGFEAAAARSRAAALER
jgi:tetratricopeptide (TPR) repeat protein